MTKEITPERDTSGKRPKTEYKAVLNGELIGYFRSHQEAQTELDRLAFETARRVS
jgi:hypothetical protein